MLSLLLACAALPVPSVETVAAPLQAAAAPVEPKWTGAVALGATYSDGNTDRRTASATGDAEYRRERDRITLGVLWNYADESRVLSDRKTQARAKYDYFFTKKFYGLAQASGEADYAAAIDLRTTIGVGLGYQFAESETWKLNGEVGLSYVDADYFGTVDDDSYTAARAAYSWDWKPNDKYNVSQMAEIFPSLEDGDDVNARVDTKGRMNLTAKMFAQIQWLYQWDNTPATGKVRNDNLVVFGLGWSF